MCYTIMKIALTTLVTLVAFAAIAIAEPLPIPLPPRGGSCPNSWTSSAGYCLPPANATGPAIPLPANGSCPNGWVRSGVACLKRALVATPPRCDHQQRQLAVLVVERHQQVFAFGETFCFAFCIIRFQIATDLHLADAKYLRRLIPV